MTFEEIIDNMEYAKTYAELYRIADNIANDKLRQAVKEQISICESDGDSVEVAYSVTTSDLLDCYRYNNNDQKLSQENKQ